MFRVRTFKVVTKVGRNVREDIIRSTTETHLERVDKLAFCTDLFKDFHNLNLML